MDHERVNKKSKIKEHGSVNVGDMSDARSYPKQRKVFSTNPSDITDENIGRSTKQSANIVKSSEQRQQEKIDEEERIRVTVPAHRSKKSEPKILINNSKTNVKNTGEKKSAKTNRNQDRKSSAKKLSSRTKKVFLENLARTVDSKPYGYQVSVSRILASRYADEFSSKIFNIIRDYDRKININYNSG